MELNDYFNYFKFQKIENGGENDLLSWLSYELGKIDINGIKNSMYSIFNYLTQEQEDYIEMDEKMSVGRPVRGRVHGRKERVLSSDASADA